MTALRVIAPDVGGGFGAKLIVYPEDVLISLLAMRFGPPVRWLEDRVEHMLTATQERTHVALAEVDPETGRIRILGYWISHDSGRLINPTIVEGQLHGAVALGLGSALFEAVRYDDAGQRLDASFMDYALPRQRRHPTAGDRPSRDALAAEPARPQGGGGVRHVAGAGGGGVGGGGCASGAQRPGGSDADQPRSAEPTGKACRSLAVAGGVRRRWKRRCRRGAGTRTATVRSPAMPTYIVLGKFTDQGIRAVRESLKREDAFRKQGKKVGARIKNV